MNNLDLKGIVSMMAKTSLLKAVLMLSISAAAGLAGDTKAETKVEAKAVDAKSAATESAGAAKVDTNLSDTSRVVAEFLDGSKITLGQVQALLMELPAKMREAPFSKLYVSLLNRLVNSKILLDAAITAGFDRDADVQKRILDAKELLLQRAFLDKESAKFINDDILRAEYDELLKLIPKDEMECEVQHILFKTKEEAQKALKELTATRGNLESRFAAAVTAKSIDETTKPNKGYLGWIRKTDLKNEALYQTEKGAVVSEVIQIPDQGYSVFFVKDKRPLQPAPFEALKPQIEKGVIPRYAAKVLDGLRKASGLQLTGLDAQPLPIPEMPPMQGLVPDKNPPKSPERKDFSAVNEKALDNSMVVGVFANGDKITLGQVRESFTTLPEQLKGAPFHQLFEPLLMRVADTKLLIEAAKKAGLETSSDLLKKQEELRKGLIQRAYLDKQLAQVITPEMLSEAYKEFLKIYPKDDMEIRIRHIMLKTEAEAKDVIKEIKAGKKFDDCVKEKSIDTNTKETGGDLGYIPKKEMPSDLADVLFKATKATLIPEPVVLGKAGENGDAVYSVIRVEDKRVMQPPALDDIKPDLIRAVSTREAAKIVMQLREQSKVVMRDIDGNIMPNAPAKVAPAPGATLPSTAAGG